MPWQGEGSLKDERVAVITAVEKKIDDAIIERREPRVTPQRRWPDVQPFAYWIKGQSLLPTTTNLGPNKRNSYLCTHSNYQPS